jgi:SAM-dependent methyltransferase
MSFAERVSAWNRGRKWHLFLAEFAPGEATTVCDVGFSDREYSGVDNYIERFYPWPGSLTAVGIDEPLEFPRRYPGVKVVRYDGVTLPFAEREFDVVWTNAVLEHVGDRSRQVAFVRQLMRVSDGLFLTTPNRYFPVETHTHVPLAHWLPKRAFDLTLRLLGRAWAAGDYMHLLGRSGLRRVLEEAGVRNARIIVNRIGPFGLDFVVIARRDSAGSW